MKDIIKMALDALELEEAQTHYPSRTLVTAITAIKQALANDALDRKAENARELGLDYEPAPVQDKCLMCGERIQSCTSTVCPKATPPVAQQALLSSLRSTIANDAWSISFQSLGQYRAALLRLIDNTPNRSQAERKK